MNNAWTRLSIAEMLIVTACVCLGYAVSGTATVSREAVVGGLLIGGAVTGPIVLLFQFIIRSRRSRPSAGEIMWLIPGAWYLTVAIFSNLVLPAAEALLAFALASMLAIPGAATVLLLTTRERMRGRVMCRWADTTGCLFAIGSTIALAYLLWNADDAFQ
jgi:hypothetical protein